MTPKNQKDRKQQHLEKGSYLSIRVKPKKKIRTLSQPQQAQGSLAAAISSQRHLQILISNFIIQIQTLTLYFKYSTSNSNFILYT